MFRAFALLALFATLTVGCSDGLVDSHSSEAPSKYLGPKSRHAGMLENAIKRDAAGKDAPELGLIVKIGKQDIMERYAVLERFKLMERYKIMERYEYNDIFGGFAISVEDAGGLEDYNAFLDMLEADPDVVWFEPDFGLSMPTKEMNATTSSQVIPWSVAAVGGTQSWANSGDGSGVVDVDVYVVDTGVASAWNDDPDDDLLLVENIDFLSSADASDPDGHGTHIAGIIGAIDDGDGTVGIAPGARIHNMRVLGDDGTADMSVVLAAIEHITAAQKANPGKPRVVNLSLGEYLGNEDPTSLDEAIEASLDQGVHYVVAAGNQGMNASHCTPAKVKGVLTVGSFDVNGVFSRFSNWGPKIDLLAPGENIISLSNQPNHTVSLTGTSMSAAHVTGAVALYVARHPSATPAQAHQYILDTAQSMVVGGPSNTSNLSVWVGERAPVSLTAQALGTLPSFLEFALFAGQRIDLEEAVVQAETGNANVHSNGELKAGSSDARVRGFGTYYEKASVKSGIFRPLATLSQQPSVSRSELVGFASFDADAVAGAATRSVDGDLKLRGDLELGTIDNPVFIFVDGRVKVERDVRVFGYGAIFSNGRIEIKASLTSNEVGALGLFTTDNITVEEDVTVEASLVSGGEVELGKGSRLFGSAAAFERLEILDDARVQYRPLDTGVAARFW